MDVPCQDEEAELLAELARIKKEREQEAAKQAAQEAAAAASTLQAELTRGNPLIASKFDKSADFQVLSGCMTPWWCIAKQDKRQTLRFKASRPMHSLSLVAR